MCRLTVDERRAESKEQELGKGPSLYPVTLVTQDLSRGRASP